MHTNCKNSLKTSHNPSPRWTRTSSATSSRRAATPATTARRAPRDQKCIPGVAGGGKKSYTFAYTFTKFPGQGQNDTPVTDARGVVTIINSLGGSRAAKFRQKFADTLVRYLGGDETLIGEIQCRRKSTR